MSKCSALIVLFALAAVSVQGQYLENTGGNGINCGVYYGNVSCFLPGVPESGTLCCSQRGICGSTESHCSWMGPYARHTSGQDDPCPLDGEIRQIDGHDEVCYRGVWSYGNSGATDMNTNVNTAAPSTPDAPAPAPAPGSDDSTAPLPNLDNVTPGTSEDTDDSKTNNSAAVRSTAVSLVFVLLVAAAFSA